MKPPHNLLILFPHILAIHSFTIQLLETHFFYTTNIQDRWTYYEQFYRNFDFNLELSLSKKYIHKKILPFVTHGLRSIFPVYNLLMKIIMLHGSWNLLKKNNFCMFFFSYARKFVFLFYLMLDIITITFLFSFFNIILLHFAQQKDKYNFTFIFNIFCSKYKFH
jgi:hypothetical protein